LQEEFSGVGIDEENMLVHRMLGSSFGVIQSIDLLSGQTTEESGLFLHGLLD